MKSGTYVSQDYEGKYIDLVEQDSTEPYITYVISCRLDGRKYIRKFYMNKPVGREYSLPRNWGGVYWADLVEF